MNNSRKIKILFKLGYTYHKAAFDPIIDIINKDNNFDAYFNLNTETKRYFFLDFSYNLKIIKKWKKSGYRFTKNKKGFDIVVTGDTLSDYEEYGNAIICFLNHGTGIKNVLYRNLLKYPSHKYHIFVEGQHRVNSLNRIKTRNKVYLIGLPKLDYYFQNKFDKDEILTKWGLNPNRKTILFAPTYKPTCLELIKNDIFIQTLGYNLIIKLHPYSWLGKYAPHRHHRIYERIVKHYPHSVLLPFEEYNIVPYYFISDIVISEASSTVFDFLALNKTGIIHDLNCDALKHSDGQSILEIDNREFLKGAFVHIFSGKQIRSAIETALNPSEKMKKTAKTLREQYFYKLDGKASLRFIDTIKSIFYKNN